MLADVQGQDDAVMFLRRFVEGKFTSPLLLVGEQGTGRRFSVIQAVKEVSCQTKEPNCTCLDCTQIDEGTYSDLTVVKPEAEGKDIGVAVIRELVDLANSYPSQAPWRTMVIDGVDQMTVAAANSLLKTLEDPPARTAFFLLTESYDRVLPTIRSRCGKVSYRPLSEGLIVSKLSEFAELKKDPAKALVYARMSEGSIGRAIHYWGSGRLGLRDRVCTLLQLGLSGNISSLFSLIDGISSELPLGLRFLDQLLYDVFMVNTDPSRLIHRDLREEIGQLREGASLETWVEFASGVGVIRSHWARINRAFHLKSLFVRTLLAV